MTWERSDGRLPSLTFWSNRWKRSKGMVSWKEVNPPAVTCRDPLMIHFHLGDLSENLWVKVTSWRWLSNHCSIRFPIVFRYMQSCDPRPRKAVCFQHTWGCFSIHSLQGLSCEILQYRPGRLCFKVHRKWAEQVHSVRTESELFWDVEWWHACGRNKPKEQKVQILRTSCG